jgi:hypothetical protein
VTNSPSIDQVNRREVSHLLIKYMPCNNWLPWLKLIRPLSISAIILNLILSPFLFYTLNLQTLQKDPSQNSQSKPKFIIQAFPGRNHSSGAMRWTTNRRLRTKVCNQPKILELHPWCRVPTLMCLHYHKFIREWHTKKWLTNSALKSAFANVVICQASNYTSHGLKHGGCTSSLSRIWTHLN